MSYPRALATHRKVAHPAEEGASGGGRAAGFGGTKAGGRSDATPMLLFVSPLRSPFSCSSRASFVSWRPATLSFVTLPIALVGGVLASYLGGGVISLDSLVGFLTVLGIVARNGIMLISVFLHLEQVEGGPSVQASLS